MKLKNYTLLKKEKDPFYFIKGSVCDKWMGVEAYVETYSMVIATNCTAICCVYKNNIVKHDSYQRTSIQIQKVAILNL